MLVLVTLVSCSSKDRTLSEQQAIDQVRVAEEGTAVEGGVGGIGASDRSNPPEDSDPWEFVCIAEDLHTPAALAIQPETGHVFVSTRAGVLRCDPKTGESTTEIAGSPTDSYGRGPVYQFGPLGLCFVDPSTLIVGEGGKPDGEDTLVFFRVGRDSLESPMKWGEHFRGVGPIRRGDLSHRGEGNFSSVCIQGETGFTCSHGDDTKGWVSRFELTGSGETLEPFSRLKPQTNRDGPSGLVEYQGKLLISQTGELDERPDSILAIVDPASGAVERVIETGLLDISSIALGPDGQTVYAVDFAWAEPERGGLFSFQLTDSTPRLTRHATMVRPTAVTFSDRGDIFVCCVEGQGEESDAPAAGKLYRHQMNGE
ncbi:MAG: hypothetical protein AAFU85_28310 [Planctomycetota bacterium]